MKIIIERQLSKKTFARISMVIFFNSWAFRAWIIFSVALGVCIFFLYGRTSVSILAAVIALLLIMIVVILAPVIKIASTLRSPRSKRFFMPSTLVFDESGMATTSAMGEGKTKWDSFKRWKKSAGCYLLYLSKGSYIAIPQSSVAPGDISAFESLLFDNIKPGN